MSNYYYVLDQIRGGMKDFELNISCEMWCN